MPGDTGGMEQTTKLLLERHVYSLAPTPERVLAPRGAAQSAYSVLHYEVGL